MYIVIGQSLLQKHEQYVNESNEIKMELDQEVHFSIIITRTQNKKNQ
jgi:hypothetical protein